MFQKEHNPSIQLPVTAHTSTVLMTATLLLLSSCQSNNLDSVTVNSGGLEIMESSEKNAQKAPLTHAVSETAPINVFDRIDELYAKAQRLVSAETGVALSSIEMDVVADEIISSEVKYETMRLTNSQFSDPKFANQFLGAVMENQHGTYAALFSTRQQRVLLSESLLESYIESLPATDHTREHALLALLIHELVHASDDKQYDIHDNRTLNFRASFAQSAVYEGHAQYLTRKICAVANCTVGLRALDDFMFGRNNPPNRQSQPVQAISRNILEYSYIEGERFMTALAARPNSEQLVAKALRAPPNDPIQILDPQSYPNDARTLKNTKLLSSIQRIEHPWLQAPWTSVESSPLKGVNLRADPERRKAAVEGFTQLITGMVALQLYDQSQWDNPPIEITLLHADGKDTAELFGESLHLNTQLTQTRSDNWLVQLVEADQQNKHQMRLYRTTEMVSDDLAFATLIGVSGKYVVQLTGHGMDPMLAQSLLQDLVSSLLNRPDNFAWLINQTPIGRKPWL